MTATLLNLVNSELRGDIVDRIANCIGEEPSATRVALGGAIPALIIGLVQKASTTQGAADLFELLRSHHLDGRVPVNASRALAATDGVTQLVESGQPLVHSVLGGKALSITHWVSAQTGIRSDSASTLLNLVAPIVFGLVAKQVRGSGWSISNLQQVMSTQKFSLPGVPRGFSRIINGTREKVRVPVSVAAPERPAPSRTAVKRGPLALPVLLVGIGLLAFFSRRTAPSPSLASPPPGVEHAGNDRGSLITIPLPDGVALNVPARGLESQLIGYVRDSATDPNKWFTFDRIRFETGSVSMTTSSYEQLRNVARILTAYPKLSLKIAGFTDNVGPPSDNQALSQQRAKNVVNGLVALGISPLRLSAQGYGARNPVADNATEPGRQQNRRIGLNVTRK